MPASLAERLRLRVIGKQIPFIFIALTFPGQSRSIMVRSERRPPVGGAAMSGNPPKLRGSADARVCANCLRALAVLAAAALLGLHRQHDSTRHRRRQHDRRRPRRRSRPRSAPARSASRLILPLSAPGNAGAAAQSMKNAAEMALAEFKNPEHPVAGEG